MLGHMTNLTHRRTFMEAVLFYLFFTMLLVGVSTFIGHYMGTLGLIEGTVGSFFDGGTIHTMIGTGFVLMIGGMILNGKGLTNDMLSVLLLGVGIYLAYTVNIMLGMVVVSYLTTLGTGK